MLTFVVDAREGSWGHAFACLGPGRFADDVEKRRKKIYAANYCQTQIRDHKRKHKDTVNTMSKAPSKV